MNASTRESPEHGNRAQTKRTSGWAEFDLKHRGKQQQRRKQQGFESDIDYEAYPLLSGPSAPQILSNKNKSLLEKPFSSVVLASENFPSLIHINDKYLQSPVPASDLCGQNIKTAVTVEVFQKLKYFHPWLDESLMQDLKAGVRNNIEELLSSVQAMSIYENKDLTGVDNKIDESNYVNNSPSFDKGGVRSGERIELSFITNDFSEGINTESKDEASLRLLMDAAKSLPLEPESASEEDDVYLIHRKDARRMIRSASRHSKAANDAYLRGDHLSAHCLSLKAQEEWTSAERLNAKAAKQILITRNSENDPWILDLHGQHAAEAVLALREHLRKVESLVSLNSLATLGGVNKELLSASMQSLTNDKAIKFGRLHSSLRQRATLLQVITGKGNHSRGAASLPSAIRNFLSENGYHFDETKPGVVVIQPKFRRQSATSITSCIN